MAEAQVGQLPIFTIADTPTYVGPNDGTLWSSADDVVFVSLQTNATRQDRAGAMNVPVVGPVTAGRITINASYDSAGTPGAVRWTLTGLGAVPWAMSGVFDLPLPGELRHSAEWVFTDADPGVTYSGAFAAGIDYAQLATDLAAGDVRLDAYTDTAPVYTQTSVHEFQLWVTIGAEQVRVLRSYPRDDAYGFGSTGRNYPRPSGRRNYGGQP